MHASGVYEGSRPREQASSPLPDANLLITTCIPRYSPSRTGPSRTGPNLLLRRRAWKQSGLRQTLNATVSKVDNLVWLPHTQKRKLVSGTHDEFCAGTCACQLRLYGIQVLPVLPGLGVQICQITVSTNTVQQLCHSSNLQLQKSAPVPISMVHKGHKYKFCTKN